MLKLTQQRPFCSFSGQKVCLCFAFGSLLTNTIPHPQNTSFALFCWYVIVSYENKFLLYFYEVSHPFHWQVCQIVNSYNLLLVNQELTIILFIVILLHKNNWWRRWQSENDKEGGDNSDVMHGRCCSRDCQSGNHWGFQYGWLVSQSAGVWWVKAIDNEKLKKMTMRKW